MTPQDVALENAGFFVGPKLEMGRGVRRGITSDALSRSDVHVGPWGLEWVHVGAYEPSQVDVPAVESIPTDSGRRSNDLMLAMAIATSLWVFAIMSLLYALHG